MTTAAPSRATTWNAALPGISPGIYEAADFMAVSEILHANAGIVLAQGKEMLVYSRLAPLVRESKCVTFAAYITMIRANVKERMRAVCALTTNHTFFYRESHHFEHFAAAARPPLVKRLEAKGAARIWSAGCSSGEETWSLAMALLGEEKSAGTAIARRDIRILASDLADHALRKARDACYPAEDITAVPEPLRRNWATVQAGTASIADTARNLVRFRTLNLLGDWPMTGRFDVIFCRNVMIYFDGPTKERLVERFADQLVPGGFLYIGHSERVSGSAMSKLTPVGPTIYQKSAA